MLGADLTVLEHAVCAEVDQDLFFDSTPAAVELAKELCARCPVIERCLRRALDDNERYGVFGGLTAEERQALRRRERRRTA
ncbi:WhiB family transcriptional regulator [Streptomyces gamaensis]|uniref:Transcriptional regulator WhiB n=1 Tax=Streptomyces gamaensis TaxID=1763542 RepID=A0ABW0YYH0_9ACTN